MNKPTAARTTMRNIMGSMVVSAMAMARAT